MMSEHGRMLGGWGTACGIVGLGHSLLKEAVEVRICKAADKRKWVRLEHVRKADRAESLADSDDVHFHRRTP